MRRLLPDYRSWTQRACGNRVGVFRVLDVLDRDGIKASVAVNSSVPTKHPDLVARFVRRGDEIVAHGRHATRMITSKLTPAQKQAEIVDALDTPECVTGTRPTGWFSQDCGESAHTSQLLADAGLDYVLDSPNDDRPYRMTTRPPLISMPKQLEWDDVQLLWLRHVPMGRYATPHRIRHLDEALTRIRRLGDVWQTHAGGIARSYRAASSANTSSVDLTRP